MSVEVLTRTMGEIELDRWIEYSEKRMLPTRRMEAYLAQICMVLVEVMGGGNGVKLGDFLFDRQTTTSGPDAEPTAEEEATFFNFNPRNRK